jgi:hypothetical protein
MPTPLINPIRVQGGTFYSFSSAVTDIQKTFTDDDARFVFSKFALLNIPDVATPDNINYQNYIVWESLGAIQGGGTSSVPQLSADNNVNLAESFQNYVLNFEDLILQGDNTLGRAYDPSQLYTTSERIFWKWLAELNAIRFRNASAAESTTSKRYVEPNESTYYKRVVKYMGDIDVVNNVSRGGIAYSEIYINVPTQHGSTPVILWKTYDDPNYGPGRTWTNNNEFIQGRDSTSTHPSGLELRAFWDDEDSNSYITSSSFGNVSNIETTAEILNTGAQKNIRISNMDGAILDFDPISYTPIANDPTISKIGEFNTVDAATDFSFNAVLVYYDSYLGSQPDNSATNLYGILILDDYVNTGAGDSYLKRFDKFKPNKVTKLNGNGYSFKLDIKFDTSISNVGVETLINDYNTFSMDLFIDASTRMQEAGDMFIETELEIIDIKKRLDVLENFYFTQEQLTEISRRMSLLEANLNNAKLSFASSTTLLDLINKNADNINQMLSGRLPLNLSYNTNALTQGEGLFFDRSVPNQLKIDNRIQGYNSFATCSNTIDVNNNPKGSLLSTFDNGLNTGSTGIANSNILSLGPFSNYYKNFTESHLNVDPSTGIESFQDDLYININDSNMRWKNGQTYRIVFSDPIDFNGFSIFFRTDSTNRFGNGNYGKYIGTVSESLLQSNKPIIDIICTDDKLYTFNIDIIR